MGGGLNNLFIKSALNRVERLKLKTNSFVTGDLEKDFKKFMLIDEKAESLNDMLYSFLENSQKNDFFNKIYENVKKTKMSWNDFVVGSGLIKETFNESYSISGVAKETESGVSSNFAPFVETIKSLPFFYSSDDFAKDDISPNCVGINQVISSVFARDNNINDLVVIEDYKTNRTKKILDFLKKLDKIKYDEDSIVIKEEGLGSKIFEVETPGRNFYIYDGKVDTFSGMFKIYDLKNMLMDQALILESNSHTMLKNKKIGEFYDFKFSVESLDKYDEFDIEKGFFIGPVNNFILLENYFGANMKDIKRFYNKFYEPLKESVLINSLGYMFDMNEGYNDKFLKVLNKKYDNDLPINLKIGEIINSGDIFYQKKLLNEIKEKYVLKDALKIISEKYFKGDGLIRLDNLLNKLS